MSQTPGDDELGTPTYDPDQRAEAQTNLDEPSATDDVSWSPPEREPASAVEGVQEDPQDSETIDDRLAQEEPDVGTDYGDPREGAERDEDLAGGDDPDAIPAEDDAIGDVGAADDPMP